MGEYIYDKHHQMSLDWCCCWLEISKLQSKWEKNSLRRCSRDFFVTGLRGRTRTLPGTNIPHSFAKPRYSASSSFVIPWGCWSFSIINIILIFVRLLRSEIVNVHLKSTDNGVPVVLLNGGLSPICEFAGLPIIEVSIAIVVGVPERQLGKVRASILVAEDLVPHVCSGVYPNSPTSLLNCTH